MCPFRRSVFKSLSCTVSSSTERLYKRQQKPGIVPGTSTVAVRFMITLLLPLHVLRFRQVKELRTRSQPTAGQVKERIKQGDLQKSTQAGVKNS